MSPRLAATIESLLGCEINNSKTPPCEWAVPVLGGWSAAGICSLGSYAWGVMANQFPLHLFLMNHRLISWEPITTPPNPPPPRPAIKGKFLECSGWKWWTHQKSLCLGHADSMSCCPEAAPPSWTCGRSLGLCFQSFIRFMFLFSLRGPDSALLEKWLGEVLHQNSVIAENKQLLPPLSSPTV